MTSVQEIVNWMFGGSVDLSKIVSIAVAIWAVVQGVIAWRSKLAQIRSEGKLKNTISALDELSEENKQLKETTSALGNIVVTAYLSNPNIDPETKKQLAAQAQKLDKASGIDLSDATVRIVDAIESYVPGTGLADVRNELEAKAEAVESTLDGLSEGTKSAIDNITLG